MIKLQKTFNKFKGMCEAVMEASQSLEQSLNDTSASFSPEGLRDAWLSAQAFYDNRYHESYYGSSTPEQRHQRRVEEWEENGGNYYVTGGGIGFSWEFNEDETITCTLWRDSGDQRGWYSESTLLANAWQKGFRFNDAPPGSWQAEYTDAKARRIIQLEELARKYKYMMADNDDLPTTEELERFGVPDLFHHERQKRNAQRGIENIATFYTPEKFWNAFYVDDDELINILTGEINYEYNRVVDEYGRETVAGWVRHASADAQQKIEKEHSKKVIQYVRDNKEEFLQTYKEEHDMGSLLLTSRIREDLKNASGEIQKIVDLHGRYVVEEWIVEGLRDHPTPKANYYDI